MVFQSTVESIEKLYEQKLIDFVMLKNNTTEIHRFSLERDMVSARTKRSGAGIPVKQKAGPLPVALVS